MVKYKSSWLNCVIWASVMAVVMAGFRLLMWYLMIYMGDTEIFSNEFCDKSLPMLLASLVVPVVMYIVMYIRYKKTADKHVIDLHGVAHDVYGKMLILPLVVIAVNAALWLTASAWILSADCMMDIFLYLEDQIVIGTFAGLHALNLVLDTVLVTLGWRFFKPNELMEKY